MWTEEEWLNKLTDEDSENGYVVSLNYRFECHHQILTDRMRDKFIATQTAVHAGSKTAHVYSAYQMYKDIISRDPDFWTCGEAVTLDRPLAMVKHGKTIYCEHWSFLSSLPEDADEVLRASALEGAATAEKAESAAHRRLRVGSAVDEKLWEFARQEPIRKIINEDLTKCGQGPLTEDDAVSWDSHQRYQDAMVVDGYIPVWWVTTQSELNSELDGAKTAAGNGASLAASALGLSQARSGPYYVIHVPESDTVQHQVYKPTTLSGGFPENYCAVTARNDAGATARLGSGERGLFEAIMVPANPIRGGMPQTWRVPYSLGDIRDALPLANTARIKQRLSLEAAP